MLYGIRSVQIIKSNIIETIAYEIVTLFFLMKTTQHNHNTTQIS